MELIGFGGGIEEFGIAGLKVPEVAIFFASLGFLGTPLANNPANPAGAAGACPDDVLVDATEMQPIDKVEVL